ncbi:2-C-methyl-D-erythritol 4-phosphate cytidylyltransferase [Rhodocytophaga aerolata]|uniref:2-C-methyl-D-erythritol 4-phosphate cytidylyltransferase n=1 Tax=Rhodocytophaga aerolata TaxID=455078 RepID=A0ABT8R1Y1_9BACT|nr:2-C-methyl-D-erythritol 4-phosphate cytidylyltransferase [Rhodocytophaga aerolata]MDO1445924.1 2-C-methyl-D-erythritol 4-phosphate cytidylyltransferase [Rhodocytophaga aerolata]
MSLYAIIVAGGTGSRMQSEVPKQFIPVGRLPVLMHTLTRFYQAFPSIQIILVLPEKDISTWNTLCKQYTFTVPHLQVPGGETRFHSVKNGLQAITATDGLVAIHDGVRPFVPVATIKHSFDVAREKGCAITVIPLKDSIRKVSVDGTSQTVDRTHFRLVQTPQTFQLPVIRQSFLQAVHTHFTDDASVAEAAGFQLSLIDGSYENIKITTPEDLLWAEAFLKKKA